MQALVIQLSKIETSAKSAKKVQEYLVEQGIDAKLFEGTYGSAAQKIFEQEGRTLHPFSFKGNVPDEEYIASSMRPGSIKYEIAAGTRAPAQTPRRALIVKKLHSSGMNAELNANMQLSTEHINSIFFLPNRSVMGPESTVPIIIPNDTTPASSSTSESCSPHSFLSTGPRIPTRVASALSVRATPPISRHI